MATKGMTTHNLDSKTEGQIPSQPQISQDQPQHPQNPSVFQSSIQTETNSQSESQSFSRSRVQRKKKLSEHIKTIEQEYPHAKTLTGLLLASSLITTISYAGALPPPFVDHRASIVSSVISDEKETTKNRLWTQEELKAQYAHQRKAREQATRGVTIAMETRSIVSPDLGKILTGSTKSSISPSIRSAKSIKSSSLNDRVSSNEGLFPSNEDGYIRTGVYGLQKGMIFQAGINRDQYAASFLSLAPFGGKAGVGTMSPTAILNVDGNARIRNLDTAKEGIPLSVVVRDAQGYLYSIPMSEYLGFIARGGNSGNSASTIGSNALASTIPSYNSSPIGGYSSTGLYPSTPLTPAAALIGSIGSGVGGGSSGNSVTGNQSVSGNSVVGGSQTVSGDTTTTGNTTVGGSFSSAGGTLSVSGSTTTMSGSVILNGSTTMNGDTVSNGNVTQSGNVSTVGNISVTGNTMTTGNVGITGNTTQTGNISVTGNATLNGTQTVNGNTLINGATTQNGNINTIGDISITGNSTTTGNVTTHGSTTNNGTLTQNGNITISGSTVMNGSQTVNGNSTFSGNTITTGNTSVTGDSTVGGSQTVTGNSTISGSQVVGGHSTISGNQTIETVKTFV